MAYVAGVDLGTTYSAAAVAGRDGVSVIELGTGSAVIPSVVTVKADGGVLSGENAARRATLEPLRSAREFKRRLGDPTPLLLGGVPYGAEALTGALLASILTRVGERMGGPPESVSLSHPASYGDYRSNLLVEAARIAEVGTVHLVPEPVAAAVHYAEGERVDEGELIAVYDLGGGTFDGSVVRKIGTGFELVGAPDGLDRFGGIDIDEAVVGHVKSALGDAFPSANTDDPLALAAFARFRDECRLAKEVLSGDTEAVIPVMFPGVHLDVRLTRAELEDMIRPRLRDSIRVLERVVASAGLRFEELSRVLLVGGSSRIPLVGEMVRTATGRPVAVDAHPKLTVALGAARWAVGSLELRHRARRSGGRVAAPSPAAGRRSEPPPDGRPPAALAAHPAPGPSVATASGLDSGVGRRARRSLFAVGAAVAVAAAVAVTVLLVGGGDGGAAAGSGAIATTVPPAETIPTAITTTTAGGTTSDSVTSAEEADVPETTTSTGANPSTDTVLPEWMEAAVLEAPGVEGVAIAEMDLVAHDTFDEPDERWWFDPGDAPGPAWVDGSVLVADLAWIECRDCFPLETFRLALLRLSHTEAGDDPFIHTVRLIRDDPVDGPGRQHYGLGVWGTLLDGNFAAGAGPTIDTADTVWTADPVRIPAHTPYWVALASDSSQGGRLGIHVIDDTGEVLLADWIGADDAGIQWVADLLAPSSQWTLEIASQNPGSGVVVDELYLFGQSEHTGADSHAVIGGSAVGG